MQRFFLPIALSLLVLVSNVLPVHSQGAPYPVKPVLKSFSQTAVASVMSCAPLSTQRPDAVTAASSYALPVDPIFLPLLSNQEHCPVVTQGDLLLDNVALEVFSGYRSNWYLLQGNTLDYQVITDTRPFSETLLNLSTAEGVSTARFEHLFTTAYMPEEDEMHASSPNISSGWPTSLRMLNHLSRLSKEGQVNLVFNIYEWTLLNVSPNPIGFSRPYLAVCPFNGPKRARYVETVMGTTFTGQVHFWSKFEWVDSPCPAAELYTWIDEASMYEILLRSEHALQKQKVQQAMNTHDAILAGARSFLMSDGTTMELAEVNFEELTWGETATVVTYTIFGGALYRFLTVMRAVPTTVVP
jgi:hypothetical protein